MYDGNPGEIDFGSSWREVRVSEGSSYRESNVILKTSVKLIVSVTLLPTKFCRSTLFEAVRALFMKN